MPLYNYLCPACSHSFEAINKMAHRACNKCPKCNNMAKQTVSRRPASIIPFKYGDFEHIDINPVYVKSKKHMKELCNRFECYAPGVLD